MTTSSYTGDNQEIFFDEATGEVSRTYTTTPYAHTGPSQGVFLVPDNAKSSEDLKDICSELGEKSNWSMTLGVSSVKDQDQQSYVYLLKMARLVLFRNILIQRKSKLADLLGIRPDHLSRTLKRMESKGYLRISTDKMFDRRDIKVLVNPAILWRGNHHLRSLKINSWYSSSMPPVDITPEVEKDPLPLDDTNFNYEHMSVYESLYDPMVTSKTSFTPLAVQRVLQLSDADFSLFLEGELKDLHQPIG